MNDVRWVADRPATSVQADPRIAQPGHKGDPSEPNFIRQMEGSVRVTVEEAAILQSFAAGLPWEAAGSRTAAFRIIGNAVPPLLAKVVIGALLEADESLVDAA